MKRRGFLAALAAVVAAPKILLGLKSSEDNGLLDSYTMPEEMTLAEWGEAHSGEHTREIIDLLKQTNDVLEDMPWVEGALPPTTSWTARSGLPSYNWRHYR
jgi:hypothetical protein